MADEEKVLEVTIRPLDAARDHAPMLALVKTLPDWFDEDALEVIDEDLGECPGFVAEFEGKGVGFILHYQPASIPAPSRTELIWMAVAPAQQGKGVGTALLGQLETALVAKDPAAELIVWTEADSSTSRFYKQTRHFYRKHGFEDWFVDDSDMEYWEVERLYFRKRLGTERPPKTHTPRRKLRQMRAKRRRRAREGEDS